MFFLYFFIFCLIHSHFFAKVKVLLRAFVKKYRKNIKTVIHSLKIKKFQGLAAAEVQNLAGWAAGWLAGCLTGELTAGCLSELNGWLLLVAGWLPLLANCY